MNDIKSKQRVADHGEVFTPTWMVEAMLDLVKDETERIDSRFLEPACGSGNFLVKVELLADNIAECRANVLEIFADYLNLDEVDDCYRAASYVLSQNLIHGDALTMRTQDAQAITFAEWGYLGKGRFQRRDFRFDSLTQSSSYVANLPLFSDQGKHEIFMPMKTYPPMTVSDLAAAEQIDTKAGGVSL